MQQGKAFNRVRLKVWSSYMETTQRSTHNTTLGWYDMILTPKLNDNQLKRRGLTMHLHNLTKLILRTHYGKTSTKSRLCKTL